MEIEVSLAQVQRVLLADGWHAVEAHDGTSTFQVGPLRFGGQGQSVSLDGQGGFNVGFSFVDHHTKRRLAGPIRCVEALETE